MTPEDPIPEAGDPDTTDAIVDHLERMAVGSIGLTTRALAGAEAGLELTFPQWRVLLVLGEGDDGARISEVAARVGVTLPATSRLLRRLERRGLTSLTVDEQDRRATRARLTDHGRAVRASILDHRRTALREVVSAIPARQRRDLGDRLRAIADGLEQFA